MKTMNLGLVIGLATSICACLAPPDETESGDDALTSCPEQATPEASKLDEAIGGWLKTAGADLEKAEGLERINTIVGNAKLVGLGEPNHGYHEMPALRNAMFRMLVEKRDFRAITLETGIIEARLVDLYVTDLKGTSGVTLDRALKEGFTHNMGEWEETRDLVTWVKKHNVEAAKSGKPLVHWGGKDLTVLGDTLTVPLAEAAPFYAKVGASAKLAKLGALAEKASALTNEIAQAFKKLGVDHIEPDHLDAITALSYDQLTDAEQAEVRTELAAAAADLDANKKTYVASSSEEEHGWARQMLVVTKQIVDDLENRAKLKVIYGQTNTSGYTLDFMNKVFGPKGLNRPMPELRHGQIVARDYTPEEAKVFQEGRGTREINLAANVGALVDRYGKTFNFAASSHLQKTRTREDAGFGVSEGNFLAQRFKADYVVIAGTASDLPSSKPELDALRDSEKKRANSVEGRLEKADGLSRYVFAIRKDDKETCARPAWVTTWLASEQLTWVGWSKFNVLPAEDYDAMIWVKAETPARPLVLVK